VDVPETEIEAKVEEYKRLNPNEKSKKKYTELVEPEFRYCKVCEGFKPERTHHCRECNRCVLMMDHHWYEGFQKVVIDIH
jgi:hypothetical protein